ncbi:MAG: HD domain-containing protein [Proteobacteria bacterium]|nr:HD domain-containing protein [Pseudomonadota bacterium]
MKTTTDSLIPYLAWFHSYVDRFITGERKKDSGILLKKDHSLEVLANARMILDSLGWDAERELNAAVAALLHDVGRFTQFARHGTFRDANSVNHGRLGAGILSREPLLADLPGRGRKQVIGTVFLHNRAFVPPGLPENLAAMTRLVRDADKIDIMRVIAGEVCREGGRDETILLNLQDDQRQYSAEMIDRIRRHEPVDYRHYVYVNDFVIGVCGWVYDMNYAAAFRRLLDTGRIETLLSLLPEDARIRDLKDEIILHVRRKAGE